MLLHVITSTDVNLLHYVLYHVAACVTAVCMLYWVLLDRPSADPEVLAVMEDAQDDLPNHPWFGNASMHSIAAPAGFFDTAVSSSNSNEQSRRADGVVARGNLDADILEMNALFMAGARVLPPQHLTRAAATGGGEAGASGAAGSVASAAGSSSAELRQRRLLVGAVGQWLGMYGGSRISGYINRPKVRWGSTLLANDYVVLLVNASPPCRQSSLLLSGAKMELASVMTTNLLPTYICIL